MKKPWFVFALMGLLTAVPTFAEAGSTSKSSKAKETVPARPKFVDCAVRGTRHEMRIEGLGKCWVDDGYVRYDIYDADGAKLIENVETRGMKDVQGVGEALKKRLLERFNDRTFESDLIKTNRDRLLSLWSKSSPKAPSSDALRREVPALSEKFGDHFDFEIRAFPGRSGGSIHLWVKPNGSGKVKVLNPEGFDKMINDDPAYRPRR